MKYTVLKTMKIQNFMKHTIFWFAKSFYKEVQIWVPVNLNIPNNNPPYCTINKCIAKWRLGAWSIQGLPT